MRLARLALLALALAATGAAAQPWRYDREERLRLREDLNAAQREPRGRYRDDDAHEARRHEVRRLREEVRSGRMSRDEAVRSYRDRFGAARPQHGGHGRLSPEERDELRRDVQEANRSLERRRGRR